MAESQRPNPVAVSEQAVRRLEDVICRMSASDGYGGHSPGVECCVPYTEEAPRPEPDAAGITDFHVGRDGHFWVCFDDYCRPGSLEEAVYLLGGQREVEG